MLGIIIFRVVELSDGEIVADLGIGLAGTVVHIHRAPASIGGIFQFG